MVSKDYTLEAKVSVNGHFKRRIIRGVNMLIRTRDTLIFKTAKNGVIRRSGSEWTVISAKAPKSKSRWN